MSKRLPGPDREASLLSSIEEIQPRLARELLRGERGEQARDAARRAVAEFSALIAERSAATGQSLKSSELALLAERDQLPDSAFPEVLAHDTPWENLYGVLVRVERTGCGYTQVREGVLLPPVKPPRTGRVHRVRLALTASTLRHQPGTVLAITATRWNVTPGPRDAGPAPVYTPETVPGTVLATVAELKSRRLVRARLQPALATLKSSSGSKELYAIADAVEMPATKKAQTDAKRRRTCVTCGCTSDDTLPKARDGRRYCKVHHMVAEGRWDRAIHRLGRSVSAVWARQFLADPQSVLVVLTSDNSLLSVRVEETDGTVLLMEEIPLAEIPSEEDVLFGRADPGPLPEWVHSLRAQCMLGRRVALTVTVGADESYATLLSLANGRERWRNWGMYVAPSDELGRRHRVWAKGGRMYDDYRHRHKEYLGGWFGHPPVDGYDVRGLAGEMRHQLIEMAGTDLTREQDTFATTWLAAEQDGGRGREHLTLRGPLKKEFLEFFGDNA